METNISTADAGFLEDVLTQEGFAKVKRRLEFKEYRRTEKIYRAGELPLGVYFISRGLVGLTIATTAGKDHLVRLFGQRQFFGHRSILAGEDYHATAVALEPTNIIFLPRQDLDEALSSFPSVIFKMSQTMASELRSCEVKFAAQTDQDVTLRVIETVIYLLKMFPEHQWTRKEIAEYCGSTPPTVIKVLAKLESRSLISQEGRSIGILDISRLEHLLNNPENKSF